MIQKVVERVKVPVCIIGIIGLIMGIINTIKHDFEMAKNGFLFFVIAVVVFVVSEVISRAAEKRRNKQNSARPPSIPEIVTPPPTPVFERASEPLTVLGMVVLLERPLRFSNDQQALIRSIIEQQKNEFKRTIAPSAQVQIIVAGDRIDDDAYIYSTCRSTFDKLDAFSDNDVFLQRVAVGSFTASDGNRGKHYAFLNRRL